ncbi:unnamed protein product [Boreogadus saida]
MCKDKVFGAKKEEIRPYKPGDAWRVVLQGRSCQPQDSIAAVGLRAGLTAPLPEALSGDDQDAMRIVCL